MVVPAELMARPEPATAPIEQGASSHQRFSESTSILLLWLVALLPVTSAAAYPAVNRGTLSAVAAAVITSGPASARLVHHALLLAIFAVAALGIVGGLSARHRLPGVPILLGVAGMTGATIAAGVWGMRPDLSLAMLGSLLVVGSWFSMIHPSPERALRQLRWIFRCYAYGSLACALVRPHYALLTHYAGLVPGFGIRLNGLTAHANVLGGLMVIGLALHIGRTDRFHHLHLAAILLSLALSQSKTSILATVLLVVVLLFRDDEGRNRRAWALWAMATAAALAYFLLPAVGVRFFTISDSQTNQLSTLTGRDQVWTVSLQVSEPNRVFGYGPKLWNQDMRLKYLSELPFAPPHAHSQFVQSLAEAGYLGLISLVFMLAVLGLYAWSTRAVNAWAGLGILSVIALRSVVEPTLDVRTLSDTTMVPALFLIFLLFSCLRSDADDAAAD